MIDGYVYVQCYNCGYRGLTSVFVGETVEDVTCPNCGSTDIEVDQRELLRDWVIPILQNIEFQSQGSSNSFVSTYSSAWFSIIFAHYNQLSTSFLFRNVGRGFLVCSNRFVASRDCL